MSYKFQFQQVPLHLIFVDGEIQRPEQVSHIKKLARDWDDLGAQIPVLSLRDNGYYHIMDGQHTVKALRSLGQTETWAQVYFNLTKTEEAKGFVIRNGGRRAVNNLHNFRVSVMAGDPLAVGLNNYLSSWGWTVAASGSGFAAVVRLRKVAEGPGGFSAAARIVETITRAWGTDPAGAHQNIIAGLGALYSKRDIDMERMITQLTKVPPAVIRRNADATTAGTPATRYGNVMLYYYNKGLRPGNKVPDLTHA